MFRRLLLIVIVTLLPLTASHAILEIKITQGANTAVPVAIVPFAWQVTGPPPTTDVAAVIGADLTRSGRFKAIPNSAMLERPSEASAVNFTNWRVLGVNDLVIGRIKPAGSGNYQVEFQLFNVYTGQQLLGLAVLTTPGALRWTAHKISDLIYQKLTGQRGAFATRIAYVEVSGQGGLDRHYALVVADSDGYSPQTVFSSNEPIMSPAWSPDGKYLAYVSFENGLPAIYMQNIYTGKRELLSDRPGLNSAPAFSPDGRQLALVLSSSPGNPDIYVMDLASRTLRRITTSAAIDTEPAWSPDGQSLYFTSDRGGSPQIYKVSLSGGTPQRVTFDGSYNARAGVTPDGRTLVMVHRENGLLHIAAMNLDSGALLTLTNGDLDKSPSFAPNGSMIIYEADYGGRGVLAEVSVDGQVRERLSESQSGVSVHAPVWGPFLSQ
ncbi:MAG: Tol-Pal system beta propeller repeat protein TolB [Gammaproteobacteria bacterium]|nr:Tol-Pal system beta propeller repeat protein TolB [Gammaproteobacteria bacterium]MBU6508563.1 Tol-Pal system beta propeller repeat protein TolB [Gammaproteobacteria bacterium]MDE1983298.1 Tol-Pal system beta propeller repeat protein TolB [Gammaproteobacteria bacterium]MDE2107861.1 Tol-Pal system beta propeller repeat protein TolB [Gammaproteobacteria bacterium]MDE2461177.1 Tol-Pal system beta propeller repeat protein TolB [Gammaproteobacteria bacterium]